jgi:hypothetical protein
MDRLGKLDPSYQPPPPEVPQELRGKKWKKIFLKNAREGENNWIGNLFIHTLLLYLIIKLKFNNGIIWNA